VRLFRETLTALRRVPELSCTYCCGRLGEVWGSIGKCISACHAFPRCRSYPGGAAHLAFPPRRLLSSTDRAFRPAARQSGGNRRGESSSVRGLQMAEPRRRVRLQRLVALRCHPRLQSGDARVDTFRPAERVRVKASGEHGFVCGFSSPNRPVQVCLDSGAITTFQPSELECEPRAPHAQPPEEDAQSAR
jgi:hypothetical protein